MNKQTSDKGLCTIITYIANILPKITKNVALYKVIKVLKILWGVLATGDAYQIDLYIFLGCTLCSCQCHITVSRGWTPHPQNFCLRRRKQTPGCLGERKADGVTATRYSCPWRGEESKFHYGNSCTTVQTFRKPPKQTLHMERLWDARLISQESSNE